MRYPKRSASRGCVSNGPLYATESWPVGVRIRTSTRGEGVAHSQPTHMGSPGTRAEEGGSQIRPSIVVVNHVRSVQSWLRAPARNSHIRVASRRSARRRELKWWGGMGRGAPGRGGRGGVSMKGRFAHSMAPGCGRTLGAPTAPRCPPSAAPSSTAEGAQHDRGRGRGALPPQLLPLSPRVTGGLTLTASVEGSWPSSGMIHAVAGACSKKAGGA